MALQVKIFLIGLCLVVSFLCYQKYYQIEVDTTLTRDKVILDLKGSWNDHQFQHIQYKKIQFQKDQNSFTLSKDITIQFEQLGFTDEDAMHVHLISEIVKGDVYRFSGPYFTIVYSIKFQQVCYQRYGFQKTQVNFVVENNNMWIVSCPSFRVLLLQQYSFEAGSIVETKKYVLKEKCQLLKELSANSDQLSISFLTFSRNTMKVAICFKSLKVKSEKIQLSSTYTYLKEDFSDYFVKWRSNIQSHQVSKSINYIFYLLSFGYFGQEDEIPAVRPAEPSHYFQVLDYESGIIFGSNFDIKNVELQSLGPKMIPFRTPLFYQRDNFTPIEQAFENSKNNEGKLSFNSYFSDSLYHQYNQMMGVYRLNPDANVHFFTFDKSHLYFSPKENLKQEDYHMVRTKKGGIVFKGNQIKGAYDKLPIKNENDKMIKWGFASDEAYQQLTTVGKEVMPFIFEAHLGYKSMFTYQRKNRLDLINGLNGESMLSHYFSKEGYNYTSSFIENNEYWVFEHNQSPAKPTLITKYELYVNSTNPRTILYIKRGYQLDIGGKVVSVQRCIDEFYYFQYYSLDDKFYGIARIHQTLLNNRQALPSKKYAGQFQSIMVLDQIPRSHQFQIDPHEEHWVIVEMQIGQNVTRNWQKLRLKHQYFILPYNIYKNGNEYYMFNARQIIMSAFDIKKIQTIKMVYLSAFLIAIGLSGVLVFLFFIAGPILAWARNSVGGKEKEKEKKEQGKEGEEKKKKKDKKEKKMKKQ